MPGRSYYFTVYLVSFIACVLLVLVTYFSAPSTEKAAEIRALYLAQKRNALRRMSNAGEEGLVPSGPPGLVQPDGADEGDTRHPERRATLLSRLTFSWLSPLVALGYRRPLVDEDVMPLRSAMKSAVLHDHFQRAWSLAQERGRARGTAPSLTYALHKAFGPYFYSAALPLVLQNLSQFIAPLLLREMVRSSTVHALQATRGC